MKKISIVMLSFVVLQSAKGQADVPTYASLKKKGDSLYLAKDFKHAASVYSQVLTLSDPSVNFWDVNRAAFTWSLAGNADSAFYFLNIIGAKKEMAFSDYLDIVDDRDYKYLHNDDRWKGINSTIFANARASFNASVRSWNEQEKIKQQTAAAFAWTFNKNHDSAFHYLNAIAGSPGLTFQHVQDILTDGYLKELKSDDRWSRNSQKLFNQLRTKYMSTNAFRNAKAKHVRIDEGHNNLHTIKTTYVTLSGLLNAAGLIVTEHKGKFESNSLAGTDLLVISNPLCDIRDSVIARARAAKQPFRYSDAASKSAYTIDEVAVIEQWVRNGGSLLLILDHAPNPKAGQLIAEALGVDIRNVSTYEKQYRDPSVDSTVATTIIFTKSKGLLGEHPIMDGVDSVTTSTGSSLVGPPQSAALLVLPATATDQDWLPETRTYRTRSAAGRTQGVAFLHGKGRVVVLGEARMISPEATSVQNRGNWQMTLNMLKWLTGNLK